MERRNALIVVGVILAAIAVPVLFLFLAGSDPAASPSPSAITASPSASASASATASATATPTAEPTEEAGPFEVAWEPVSLPDEGAEVRGVVHLDGTWFALGAVEQEGAIWTSQDGREWTRAEIDSLRADDEVTVVTGLAALEGRLVAIGIYGLMQSDQVGWATWISEDGGATWTERREGANPFAMHAIVPGGPGLIGAGWNYSGTTPFDSWVAVSEDGLEWELLSTPFPEFEVLSLAVLGERIVAVGSAFEDVSGDTSWFSDDGGETWTAGDAPGATYLYDLVATDDALVAIGRGVEDEAAAWFSADGAAWERVAIVEGAEGHGLAEVDAGLVAVGNVLGQDVGPELSWTSVDGRTWEPGQEIGDGSVQMLAADGAGSTVVAGGRCLGSCDTVLWIGEVTR